MSEKEKASEFWMEATGLHYARWEHPQIRASSRKSAAFKQALKEGLFEEESLRFEGAEVQAKSEHPKEDPFTPLNVSASVTGFQYFDPVAGETPLLKIDRLEAKLTSRKILHFLGSNLKGLEVFGHSVSITLSKKSLQNRFRDQSFEGSTFSLVDHLKWNDGGPLERDLGFGLVATLKKSTIEVRSNHELIAKFKLGVVDKLGPTLAENGIREKAGLTMCIVRAKSASGDTDSEFNGRAVPALNAASRPPLGQLEELADNEEDDGLEPRAKVGDVKSNGGGV